MHKYIICRLEGKTQVLKLFGTEGGIPVYEHYRTLVDRQRSTEPGSMERAGDLIRRLEATA